MDLGPQWPFWLQAACALLGMALLAWAAWRHADAVRRWPAAALGLLLWGSVAVIPWWPLAAFCLAARTDLPGCDWEFHRAPTDPWDLAYLILAGGAFHAWSLGGPVAALVFSIRLARGWRRRLRTPLPPPAA